MEALSDGGQEIFYGSCWFYNVYRSGKHMVFDSDEQIFESDKQIVKNIKIILSYDLIDENESLSNSKYLLFEAYYIK